jgi:hypothetical protein
MKGMVFFNCKFVKDNNASRNSLNEYSNGIILCTVLS